VLAGNIGPLPHPPGGRYAWRCHINDETREDWRLAFSVRGTAIKGDRAHEKYRDSRALLSMMPISTPRTVSAHLPPVYCLRFTPS
jgi:hypothetical protein